MEFLRMSFLPLLLSTIDPHNADIDTKLSLYLCLLRQGQTRRAAAPWTLRVHLSLRGGHRKDGKGLRISRLGVACVVVGAVPQRSVRV